LLLHTNTRPGRRGGEKGRGQEKPARGRGKSGFLRERPIRGGGGRGAQVALERSTAREEGLNELTESDERERGGEKRPAA